MEKVFGLIGQTVSHSFSKSYFDEKFFREGLRDHHYELFPLTDINEIEALIQSTKGLTGLNVTIPYKEQVMQFLDEVDPAASNGSDVLRVAFLVDEHVAGLAAVGRRLVDE